MSNQKLINQYLLEYQNKFDKVCFQQNNNFLNYRLCAKRIEEQKNNQMANYIAEYCNKNKELCDNNIIKQYPWITKKINKKNHFNIKVLLAAFIIIF